MAKGQSIWNLIATGLGRPKTQIYNNSDKNIFLIPISCLDGYDPENSGQVVVDDSLGKVIKPGKHIEVDSRKYDYNDIDPSSQLFILFRVGGHSKVIEFLGDLQNENTKGFQVKPGENLLLHFHLLGYRQLFLKYNEAELVIEDVNKFGQVNDAEAQNQSKLVNTIEQMEDNEKKLQKKVEELQKKVEAQEAEIRSLKENPGKSSKQNRK